MQLMLQATVCDCLLLDPFAFEEDGLSASEVDVSRGKIVEALMIARLAGRESGWTGRKVLEHREATNPISFIAYGGFFPTATSIAANVMSSLRRFATSPPGLKRVE
jgi:hypothetical protein